MSAINATMTLEVTLTGGGLGAGAAPFIRTQSTTNVLCPGPTTWTLSAGNNSFTTPASPFTLTNVTLVPPSGSTNTKVIKGVNGDTGVGNWTAQTVSLPSAASATIVINSVGGESLTVAFS